MIRLYRTLQILLVLIIPLLTFSESAEAVVFVDNQPNYAHNANTQAGVGGDFFTAPAFLYLQNSFLMPEDGYIKDITWWGEYAPLYQPHQRFPDSWTLLVWEAVAGMHSPNQDESNIIAGALLWHEIFSHGEAVVALDPRDNSSNVGTSPAYSHAYKVKAPFFLEGGKTYFFAPFANHTTFPGAIFGWQENLRRTGPNVALGFNHTGFLADGLGTWAYQLKGERNLTIIPEPSTLILLGTGLLGVAFRRR